MKAKKVILDTNLWISYLITKDYPLIDQLIDNEKIRLIFSTELLEEFIEVANRPKLKKHFKKQDLLDLLETIDTVGKVVEVKSDVKICRDKKDNFLLNLAIDSRADFLITGDADLLVLKEIKTTKIISITQLPEFLH